MNLSHHKFKLGNNQIDYIVIRSKRLKTSEVIVDDNSVVIRVPYNKPDSEIDNILKTKRHWIIDRKQEFHKAHKQIKKSNFAIGSTLPYLGKNYRIAKDSHNNNWHLEFLNGKFVFSTNDLSRSNLSDIYEKWLLKKSEKLFLNKVAEYSKKLNLKPPRIIIKNLRNRWGSVTKEGVLNLNVNLLKAPNEVIDYVIIHEMCHFIIKDHSHHFWELVRSYFPRYQDAIMWLDVNSRAMC